MSKDELIELHNYLSELESLLVFRKAGGAEVESPLAAIGEVQETIEKIVKEFRS